MTVEDEELYDDLYSLSCRYCKYWRVNADREESVCKRIDHKTVKFAKPWFKSYDCGESHGICGAFEPEPLRSPVIAERWCGFEKYIALKAEAGDLRYPLRPVWFCLNNDFSVRYGVDYWDFVNGEMIKDGYLMCKKKQYYRISRKSPIGYELITEDTEPVRIEGVRNE